MIKFKNILVSIVVMVMTSQSFAQFTSVQEQASEKNYISNGGFENAASGWKAYKNTAQALPITGTGGAPAATITASTSSPIAGKSSGLLTKTAANLQGEGISYAFSVDPAAKGKMLTISGLYQIISGTYSGGASGVDSDVEAYIYDVDAGTITQPAGFKLDGGVSGINYNIAATFQTSITSTNYRLILHIATVSASAFSLKLDSIKIGVQNRPQGPPVTDMLSFTSTLSGFGNATQNLYYKRDGNEAVISGAIVIGSTAPSSTLQFSLPPGLNYDATKVAINGAVNFSGTANGYRNSTGATYYASVALSVGSTNTLQFNPATGGGGVWTPTVPQTWSQAPADRIYIDNVRIPIQGWSSTVTMSDSADTRVVAATASRATTAQTVGTAQTKIQWNATNSDTHGALDTVTNFRYTVPVAGKYQFSGALSFAPTAGFTAFSILLFKNGGAIKTQLGIGSTTVTSGSPFSFDDVAVSGDYYEIFVSTTGGSTSLLSGGSINGGSTWDIKRISGPSQIAASESVNLSYTSAAGQSFTNLVAANMSFTTKEYDTHNAWGGTTFTAPVSGKYAFKLGYQFNAATWNSLTRGEVQIVKNGIAYGLAITSVYSGPTTGSYVVNYNGSFDLNLIAGDTIIIQLNQNSGATQALLSNGAYNRIQITRIGN